MTFMVFDDLAVDIDVPVNHPSRGKTGTNVFSTDQRIEAGEMRLSRNHLLHGVDDEPSAAGRHDLGYGSLIESQHRRATGH